jgi:FAD/FMN-containing dehydrogenase
MPVQQLSAAVKGRVITPEDADYDPIRAAYYGTADRKPAAIVRVAGADDVAAVVSFARDNGARLAVRSGGHSFTVHAVMDGEIVLDLAEMKGLDIDLQGRTVWAETGLTAGELTRAIGAQGFAVGFGDTGSVGIGGITLGGGIGYLVRKHGMTIDSLLAAEVVTADGQLVRTDAETHPDLFWAIRGGGGNFGVATRFLYKLHEVGTIVGGMLILPATADTVAAFVAEAEAAPDELSTIANVMSAPPMPFVPAEHHGKLIIMALMCYVGEVEAGQRAMAPFRAIAEPIADMVRPIPYHEIYPPDEEEFHMLSASHSMFVETIDRGVASTIVDHLGASTAQMAVAQIRVLGGAMARVPADATAYAHRRNRILVNVAALFMNPEEEPAHKAWVAELASALNQGDTGVYVNFLNAEGEARVRDAYPDATWDRLRAVKRRYDPTNVFRLNHNIPPAAEVQSR